MDAPQSLLAKPHLAAAKFGQGGPDSARSPQARIVRDRGTRWSRVEYLDDIVATVRRDMEAHLGRGKVADYIPALARVDPRNFAIAIVTCDGRTAEAGGRASALFDPEHLQGLHPDHGAEQAGRRSVGAGRARALRLALQLHRPAGAEKGMPRNPLINAGALVVTDALLDGGDVKQTIAEILDFMRKLADDIHRDR